METKRISFSWSEVEPLCVLRLLARKWWLILMAALIGSMLTSATLEHLVTRSYSSSVTFVVTSKSSSSLVGNISVAGEVANVYSQLLQSDLMSAVVHESLGNMPGTITAKQLGNTNLIKVTVTSDAPKSALLLVRAVIDNYAELSDYVSSQAVLSPLDAPSVTVSVMQRYNTAKMSRLASLLCAGSMVAILILMSLTSGTIQTREGAKNRLDSRILASIPHEKEAVRRAGLAKGTNKQTRTESILRLLGIERERHVRHDLKVSSPTISFAFAESIYRLAAKFEHAQSRGHKVFLFSSVSEAEGKSTLSANTALSLAEKHARVLFIDLDLRRPVQNQFLGLQVSDQKELGFMLSDGADAQQILDAALVEPTTGLHSLLSSKSYTDMIELITSPLLADVLALAREQFDYVIVDSPPLGYFSDSELLSDLCDASVLVVRQDIIPAAEINDAIDALNAGKAEFLGCILNDMQHLISEGSLSYGAYGSKYGKYGYGSSQGHNE